MMIMFYKKYIFIKTYILLATTSYFYSCIGIEVKMSWKICDWKDANYIDKNKYRKKEIKKK